MPVNGIPPTDIFIKDSFYAGELEPVFVTLVDVSRKLNRLGSFRLIVTVNDVNVIINSHDAIEIVKKRYLEAYRAQFNKS